MRGITKKENYSKGIKDYKAYLNEMTTLWISRGTVKKVKAEALNKDETAETIMQRLLKELKQLRRAFKRKQRGN